MTTRTRNFVIVSLAVLGIGLGTGIVAYYVAFPAGALGRQGGPDELAYVPRDATAIAFANVHEIMTSELRQKVRRALPMQENGQRELETQTGINIETDIDRVVACLYPDRAARKRARQGRPGGRGPRPGTRRSRPRAPCPARCRAPRAKQSRNSGSASS